MPTVNRGLNIQKTNGCPFQAKNISQNI